MEIDHDLHSLVSTWDRLGPRERSVFKRIGERLLAGQNCYGKLTYRKKNWTKEAQEEAMDMCVYLSAMLEDVNENT